MSAGTVHTLDMAEFLHGSDEERLKFSQNLVKCFASQGFVKLINHGIPEIAIQKVFEWNRDFFELPKEIKERHAHPPCANPNRGWVAPGQEASSAIKDFEKGEKKQETDEGAVFDAKESFDQGNSTDSMYDNIWPDEDELPGFRSFMEVFYELCHEAHMNILRALEYALDNPEHPFKIIDRCLPNVSEMRLNYYPPIDIHKLKSAYVNRISEHTDFGTVTLLFQDSAGGLEIEDQSKVGKYFPVECESSSVMLVNIGDSLQRLTNDVMTSVSHRVTVPASKKELENGMLEGRRSVAYFAKVNREQSIQPLDRFVSDKMPPKYPHMSAWDWNQVKLERIYGVC